MKELKKISRWITIQHILVTPRHSLYCYAEKDTNYNGKFDLWAFRWNGRLYAVNQFLSRWGMMGFDSDCKEYPSYISGYDGENYYNPILCEISPDCEKIRLYREF